MLQVGGTQHIPAAGTAGRLIAFVEEGIVRLDGVAVTALHKTHFVRNFRLVEENFRHVEQIDVAGVFLTDFAIGVGHRLNIVGLKSHFTGEHTF